MLFRNALLEPRAVITQLAQWGSNTKSITMFFSIFSFEIKYRWKRPATWAYFGILFLFGFLVAIYGSTPASEKTLANSPFAIAQMMSIISLFGILLSSAIMGVPVYRDIEYNTKNYFFSYPFNEKEYLLGRYLGSLLILFFVSLGLHFGLAIGFAVGPFLGLEEADRFGGFHIWHYIQPTFTLYWPNLFFAGSIFFALVAMSRKIFAAYAGGLLLFVGYLLSSVFTQDLENQSLVNILDPFGLTAFNNITKYWTPLEQNTLVAALTDDFLWNRLLWVGVGLLILLLTLWRFNFQGMMNTSSGKKTKPARERDLPKGALLKLPRVGQTFSQLVFFRKMFYLGGLEFKNIIRDTYFLAILMGAVIFLFLGGWFGNPTYGTPSLPLTYYMIESKSGDFGLFVFIIIIFYTGEVVHRDKSVRYANIADALPVPNWMMYGSKFLSLVYICFLLASLVIVSGVINQLLKGYTDLQLWMYFTDLYLIELPKYIEVVILAFFIHILVNSKFLGHVVAIAFWVAMIGIQALAEINYDLLFFRSYPGYLISDMNGFGHFWTPILSFHLYWLSLGGIMLVLGNLFWQRGAESSWKMRIKTAKNRINKLSIAALTMFSLLWVGTGAFIYYNISVLHTYRTADERRELQVAYENTYKQYNRIPQPKIIDVNLKVDVFPQERKTLANGNFFIVNKSDQAIDSIHLNMSNIATKTSLVTFTVDGKSPEVILDDKELDYRIYKLETPMMPNDTLPMQMVVDARYIGFPGSGFGQSIIENGTFFNAGIFPSFGYNEGAELSSDKYRKKYGLPEKDYVAPTQDDPYGLSTFLFNDDAEYVTFEAVVSTSPDQIAIAPGYLQKEWEENGRKYYHYKMTGEMDLFFNISSARYAVHKDEWRSGDKSINIEIFHHPTHDYNIDHFVDGIKRSMDYYNKHFSPYQYGQMRILEFPRYASFAQSFPNTVPYSEGFGWAADFSDPEDTDYAFYVTAHEVAHQWWGHQITPSLTRGANQISESMAEYSALMVLKKEYGDESMQRFLKYSLDQYLRGRSSEGKFEKTLLDNDTRSYVWYRKGSVVLYALQDYVGEDSLNTQFAAFLDTAAFRQEPPFATANEWYSYIKKAAPDSLQYFVEDCFEHIVIYENRAKEAFYEKLDNGQYKVTLQVASDKIYYDGFGKELSRGGSANLIEVGIFDEDGKNDRGMSKKSPLLIQKVWISPGEQTLEFIVDKLPVKAGIDPYNKLIDRVSDDNLINVEEKE